MHDRHPKLKRYAWCAIDRFNEPMSGIFPALNALEVKRHLQSRELLATKIRLQRTWLSPWIHTLDRDLLIKEIATLLSAGLPFITMLNLLQNNWKKSYLHNIILELQQAVQGGQSFAGALCATGLFESVDARLIAAGSASGKLIDVLQVIITYRIKRLSLKRNIKKALLYPLTVAAISMIITVGFIFNIIPSFAALFKQSGVALPAATQHLLQGAFWLQKYGAKILLIIIINAVVFIYTYRSNVSFKHKCQYLLTKLPFVRALLQRIAIERFTSALALTAASGLTLIDALSCIEGVTGNHHYDNRIRLMSEQMAQGVGLSGVMRESGLFSDVFVQRVKLGEDAGCLNTVLQCLAADQQIIVDDNLDAITRMLEPCIMIGLGLWIFGLVIALYLPLFEAGGLM